MYASLIGFNRRRLKTATDLTETFFFVVVFFFFLFLQSVSHICGETDSIAYTFGQLGGLVKFTFGESERPDTHFDQLTIGFRTSQSDAVMAVVYSATSKDYVEVQLVSYTPRLQLRFEFDSTAVRPRSLRSQRRNVRQYPPSRRPVYLSAAPLQNTAH